MRSTGVFLRSIIGLAALAVVANGCFSASAPAASPRSAHGFSTLLTRGRRIAALRARSIRISGGHLVRE